jgi:hypothetical protein
MNDALYLGINGPNSQRFSAGHRLGQVAYTPIELDLDTSLPTLGQDANNNYLNRDYIVIPHGRIVGLRPRDLTDKDRKSILTMANGVDPLNAPTFAKYSSTPFGYAPYHLFKGFRGLPADAPLGVRHETISMPYTSANESYNLSTNGGSRLVVGEYVMPYYGSKDKQAANAVHTGKMVRYIGRHVIKTVAGTASAQVLLDAKFPAFLPTVLYAYDASGAVYTGTEPTLSYVEASGKWKATFATAVKGVVFEYGASDQQRIGQIMGIEPVGTAGGINGSTHEQTGWFKWVQTNYGAWEFPLILNRMASTAVTDEAVTVTDNAGTLAYAPVIPFKTVTVKVTGTRYETDGTETALTDEVLTPMDEAFFGDVIRGTEYSIDILTGAIEFTGNLDVDSAKVTYSYEGDFRNGITWDAQGIFGLTDGSGPSGITGIQPHLDVVGVYGELRVAIL